MDNEKTILIVDDEVNVLNSIRRALRKEGYEIITAQNGREALKKIDENKIDLILTDAMMPEIDGFELTRSIRANEDNRLIPVVVVSALNNTADRINATNAGCDDFITKPFDIREVKAVIKTLLKLSYYRRQLDEKEKFASVINSISSGIVVCKPDWSLHDINLSAKKYLNIADPADVNILDLMYKNFSPSVSRERLINSPESNMVFYIIREETKKFKSLCLHTVFDVIKNPKGEMSSIVLTLEDVTEQHSQEALKQEFISLISHKLMTPIAIINQILTLFQKGMMGDFNEKQKKSLEQVKNKTDSLTILIQKLIGFTTVSKKKLELNKEKIEVGTYLQEYVNLLLKRIKNKKVEINIEYLKKEVTVKIDKFHLDMIMENLIENALKFNDNDIIRINVSVRETPEKAEFTVADNGYGIPPEEQNKVFEKFYQVEKYFTGNVEGMGLGLVIVKHLIELYGGEIKLESDIDKGSNFIFTVPITH